MNSIKVTILGRSYPLKVEDGDETFMREIANHVDERFKSFQRQLSKQNDSTVMTLAALSIAEELFLEKRKNDSGAGADEALAGVNETLRNFLGDLER